MIFADILTWTLYFASSPQNQGHVYIIIIVLHVQFYANQDDDIADPGSILSYCHSALTGLEKKKKNISHTQRFVTWESLRRFKPARVKPN